MAPGKQPEEMIPGMKPPKKVGVFAWLRGRFFAGMVIAAPLAATYFILQFLINFIDSRVKPLLPGVLKPELGAVTANLIGRSLLSATDRILSRIPIVRNVYAALKQLTEVLANNQQASFDRCVMVEYPKKGSWCLGFVSSGAKGEIGARLGSNLIGVFVPTTPNPTSGFLIYVDASECVPLDMTVEEGAKMILTAGLVVPDFVEAGQETNSVAKSEVRTEQLTEQS